MKCSKTETIHKSQSLPELRFEDQQLTSFSGLIVFQRLFSLLDLREQLRLCFRHLKVSPIFGHGRIVLLLIVHFLLGFRSLRQLRFYADDPIVQRVVGLKRLPDVATISRTLSSVDEKSVGALENLLRQMVLDRLASLKLRTVTLDFDGSVIGTGRRAEGTAVGFNRKKKGQRSYYPLFCTVAQTSQVLDVLHRSGNVHDSNGAQAFIERRITEVRQTLPTARIEARMDAAFFSDPIVQALEDAQVEYTLSAPFERFAELKDAVETQVCWEAIDESCAGFETLWKPKSWRHARRLIVVRKQVKLQCKEPLQLDLFTPREWGYDFKVILTNKSQSMRNIVSFHNGRGSQEGIFAELKSANAMAYVPTNTWLGNRTYLIAALMAHNLARELQMRSTPAHRKTSDKRPALWIFSSIDTIRQQLIQRAGRLIRPQGKLTLSMSANSTVKNELLQILDALENTA